MPDGSADNKVEETPLVKRRREREPLNISCKSTKCDKGLHCFLEAPKTGRGIKKSSSASVKRGNGGSTSTDFNAQEDVGGTDSSDAVTRGKAKGHRCWDCGADLVDWSRVYQRDFNDAEYTLSCLKIELIRHHFWHIEIDEYAINHALRKGLTGMRLAAEKRIKSAVSKGVPLDELTFDGRQTPFEGNALLYAQHATATCCRKCMEVWYDIPRTDDLTEEQIRYFTDIVMLFVKDRLPFLGQEGIKVPPIKKLRDAT